jgi:hypothetical protein
VIPARDSTDSIDSTRIGTDHIVRCLRNLDISPLEANCRRAQISVPFVIERGQHRLPLCRLRRVLSDCMQTLRQTYASTNFANFKLMSSLVYSLAGRGIGGRAKWFGFLLPGVSDGPGFSSAGRSQEALRTPLVRI